MFRSFFPNPRLFFPAGVIWVLVCGLAFYTIGPTLQQAFSLGPWLAIAPTEADPEPFFNPDKVWLYQYIIFTGYTPAPIPT